jgi:hypothetical protein
MLALLVLMGCPVDQEFTPSTGGNGQVESFPDIEIEPDALVFEMADPGSETSQVITIENRGELALHVTNLVLSGTTAFAVGTEETSATIAPGSKISVPIIFSPVNPEDFASLVVTSDDPDSGSLTVPLTGSGKIPQLFVSPNPYNFGSVLLDCPREQPITLSNIGNGMLIVDKAVTTALGFDIDATALPAYLGPDESVALDLRFEPEAVLDYGGELWITSNSLVDTTTVSLSGHGTTDAAVADEFWQGDGPWDRTDIFFYVDQSGSMADDQDNMIANFSGFVDMLEKLDLDWQIIISTRDTGCSNTGILTPETPNLESAFLEGVRGSGGRYTEAGLTVAAGAINRSVPGECNEGFLRSDSKTSVVLVSDEPDQSPGSYSGYVAQIQAIAPTAAITAIVGDVPNGCATADPGYGYYEAALATHGAFLSICEADWSTYFEAIAVLSSTGQTDRFGLSSPPDPATITVKIDHVPVTSGWAYEADGQAVVFESASVPNPGAYILVEYNLKADCAD